jgi:WD40 repeat protein
MARVWDAASGHLLFEPLLHHGTVGDAPDARFLPHGNRLATVTPDGVLRLWDMPVPPLPIPHWLPDLAEAVAVKQFDAQRRSRPVNASRLAQLRQQLVRDSSTNFYAHWAKWFFADRSTRPASPFASDSVSQNR